MSDPQAVDPVVPGNPLAIATPGQDGSVLTGKSPAADGTPPLAESAPPPATPAWMAQLPDDLKRDPGFTKFPTIGELGKAYKALEGKIGKTLALPGKDATPEEKAAFRKALGVPDKPSDYKLGDLKLPEKFTLNKARQAELLKIAHVVGMNQQQTEMIHKMFALGEVEAATASLRAVRATQQEAEAELKAEYGADLTGAMNYMRRGLDRFVSKAAGLKEDEISEVMSLIDKTGLGNHKGFLKVWVAIGKATGDHAFVQGSTTGQAGGERDLAEIMYPSTKAS
jgi:hypothetical protein